MNVIMRKSHQPFFWSLICLLILAAGGAGCAKNGVPVSNGPVATFVSVMNLAPYAPTVDVYLNDTLVSPSGGIPPGKYSTQYAQLRPGVYDVKFKKTGTDSLLDEIPASSFDTTNFYTLVLYNTQPGGGTVNAIRIHDDFSMVSPASANYRFLNLSPDAPRVDLYLDSTVIQSGRTPADNTTNVSLSVFQPIAPSTYNLGIKLSGTDSVLASLNAVPLTAGNVYTIFLSGKDQTSNSLSLNVLTEIN
jgi:Domain of unknown function (DUF4397)